MISFCPIIMTTLDAERIESVLKQICRNLNKSLAKKIMKAFEDDPDSTSSFERVLDDALDLYRRRLANAQKTAEQQHAKGRFSNAILHAVLK